MERDHGCLLCDKNFFSGDKEVLEEHVDREGRKEERIRVGFQRKFLS